MYIYLVSWHKDGGMNKYSNNVILTIVFGIQAYSVYQPSLNQANKQLFVLSYKHISSIILARWWVNRQEATCDIFLVSSSSDTFWSSVWTSIISIASSPRRRADLPCNLKRVNYTKSKRAYYPKMMNIFIGIKFLLFC